jgi:putative two-component system response regulator
MTIDSRVLIVDDEQANVMLLEAILGRAGYSNVRSTNDPREVTSLCPSFCPDIVLLDLHMPHLSGFEVMERLEPHIDEEGYLPILVLTADATSDVKQAALAAGAKDFLTKPFEVTEVLLRINNLLDTRHLHLELRDQNRTLEDKVRARTEELEAAQLETLRRLALAAEYRDDDTGEHAQRVGRLAALVAHALGLPPEEVDLIRLAAPLHDVGKIGVSDSILLKPSKLTPDEFEVVKSHTEIGASILSGSGFEILRLAELIAVSHHERWDGTGYAGWRENEIPLAGRIVSVVDVFDALTHERPYKKAWPVEEAVAEIQAQSGRQFDPRVVAAFVSMLERENLRQAEGSLLAAGPSDPAPVGGAPGARR